MAKQQIPDWVNFGEWLNQGTKYAPTFALPDNKILAVYIKRADISMATTKPAFGAGGVTPGGVTFYDNPNYPNDKRWQLRIANDVFKEKYSGKSDYAVINDKGFGAQNLTIADAERCAVAVENLGLEGDQFGEGQYSMPDYKKPAEPGTLPNSQTLYRAYYQKRRQQYPSNSVPPIYGQYGSFTHYPITGIKWQKDGTDAPNTIRFRQWYESFAKAQASCSYFSELSDVRGASVKHYMVDFNYAINYYMTAHNMEIMRRGMNVPIGGFPATDPMATPKPIQGGLCPLFIWGGIEHVGGGQGDNLHNGMFYERPVPAYSGTLKTEEHPVLDFDHVLAMCFAVGFVRGSGVIAWDNGTIYGSDPAKILPLHEPTPDNTVTVRWEPAGTPTPPVASQSETDKGYPDHPLNWHDAVLVASQWYKSCERTNGVQWKYVRYRRDDSSVWTEPTPSLNATEDINGPTILDHASFKDGPYPTGNPLARRGRGDCMARVKNNAIDWYYYDPSLPKHKSETIVVEVAGQTFRQTVQGSTLCVCNETF